ncbi:MAG: hypothetical protein H6Q78_88 [Candidatus Krumholzibacteriota bacterium]|nr:hypothetical protein [Candidatus Krumholzibacteriota bacterium]
MEAVTRSAPSKSVKESLQSLPMGVEPEKPDENPVEGLDAPLAISYPRFPQIVFSDLDMEEFTIRSNAAKKRVFPEDPQIQAGGLDPNLIVYVAHRGEKSVIQLSHYRIGDQHSRIGVRGSLQLKLVQRSSS